MICSHLVYNQCHKNLFQSLYEMCIYWNMVMVVHRISFSYHYAWVTARLGSIVIIHKIGTRAFWVKNYFYRHNGRLKTIKNWCGRITSVCKEIKSETIIFFQIDCLAVSLGLKTKHERVRGLLLILGLTVQTPISILQDVLCTAS